jgi:hypothetical protein
MDHYASFAQFFAFVLGWGAVLILVFLGYFQVKPLSVFSSIIIGFE